MKSPIKVIKRMMVKTTQTILSWVVKFDIMLDGYMKGNKQMRKVKMGRPSKKRPYIEPFKEVYKDVVE